MRILFLATLLFVTIMAKADETCFVLSFEEDKPTEPPERLCIGNTNPETKRTPARLLLGDVQVALFDYFYEIRDPDMVPNQISRSFSMLFLPAINAFSFRMLGKIDPISHVEKGTMQIGNQWKGFQSLYYVSE